MPIFQTLKTFLTDYNRASLPWEPKQAATVISQYLSGKPYYGRVGPEFRDYAQGGYSKNTIVYACINELATSFNEPFWQVLDDNLAGIPHHPLVNLLENPNPFQSQFEFFELSILYLMIAGNTYWHKMRNAGNQVVELWPLRPDRVAIVPDSDNFIQGYIYTVGTEQFPIPPDDIIHFRLPDPLNDYLGMPPLRAGERDVATDNEVTDFTMVTLQNRAVPGTVIETNKQADDKELDRYTEAWKQKFGGSRRGEPAFMPTGVKIHTVGLSNKDMMLPDLSSFTEARICSMLQVPPIVIGAKVGLDAGTYSNYAQAVLSFWQETMIPLTKRFSQKVSQGLLPEFDSQKNRRVIANVSQVSALRGVENEQRTARNSSVSAGYMMVNEARIATGLSEDPNGWVYLRPLNIVVTQGKPPPNAKALPDPKKKALSPPKLEYKSNPLLSILGRNAIADSFLELYNEWAVKEFSKEAREVMGVFNKVTKGLTPAELNAIITGVDELQILWEQRAIETITPLTTELMGAAGDLAGADIGIAFNVANPDVEAFVKSYTVKFGGTVSTTSSKDVQKILLKSQSEGLSIAETQGLLRTKFTQWTESRAVNVARTETIRTANQGAKISYKVGGVTKMAWSDSNDDDVCPYCMGLDGKTVSIDANFIEEDEVFQPEGASVPLNTSYEGSIGSPPAHNMCRCGIVPVVD